MSRNLQIVQLELTAEKEIHLFFESEAGLTRMKRHHIKVTQAPSGDLKFTEIVETFPPFYSESGVPK